MLATDDGGVVTFANEAATEMFETSAEVLVGRDVAGLIGVDGTEAGGALALTDVLGGTRWRGDLTVRRPRGDSLVAAVTVTPVRDAQGTVVDAIIALEDMTDIRRAEAAAAASDQRLRLAHAAAELGTWHWNAVDDSNALERFEIATLYAPGGDDFEHVGGDWYDAIGTSTGALVLVIGDVMGRGVRAATTMIHVRAGIRGLLTVEPAPAALLEAVDEMVSRDAPDQFVTTAAVLVDPDAGTLELCNAGHVPLLLVRPDGTTAVIGDGSGAPLGVLPRLARTSEQVALEPGCIVVMVTDGVVESRDRDIDQGIEQLRRCAAELARGPLDELVAGVAALADDRLRDDVTVVAARLR